MSSIELETKKKSLRLNSRERGNLCFHASVKFLKVSKKVNKQINKYKPLRA